MWQDLLKVTQILPKPNPKSSSLAKKDINWDLGRYLKKWVGINYCVNLSHLFETIFSLSLEFLNPFGTLVCECVKRHVVCRNERFSA